MPKGRLPSVIEPSDNCTTSYKCAVWPSVNWPLPKLWTRVYRTTCSVVLPLGDLKSVSCKGANEQLERSGEFDPASARLLSQVDRHQAFSISQVQAGAYQNRGRPCQTVQEFGFGDHCEGFWRGVRQHQSAVLVQRDQLAVRPAEGSFLYASLLPEDLAGRCFHRAQDRLAPLASARKIERSVNIHGFAIVQAKTVRTPRLFGDDLHAFALEPDHLRAGAIFGRDEQQISRTPYGRRHADAVVRLERLLPLKVAIDRIEAEDEAVHHLDQLIETVYADQQRR